MHPQIEKVWRLSFMSVLEIIEMVFVETILGGDQKNVEIKY